MSAYGTQMFTGVIAAQKPRAAEMKDAPAFYRNLEANLDTRRADEVLLTGKPRWGLDVADFTTSDFLSLNRSGKIREAFLAELAAHPDFWLSASGSRVQFGNYDYLCETEREIAEFYKADGAVVTHSGFLANVAVLQAIALHGDAYVYDELVHASMHDGMALGQATHKIKFPHNDVDALREILEDLRDNKDGFRTGTRSAIILIESIYSMDGDVCPLQEMVSIAKEVFPLGNAQFVIDEAHSTGVLGPRGVGLVSMLGLEKEIAVRVHMASKALASTGGVVLCNDTIRAAMLNHARYMVYAGAPSFPMAASIRVGFRQLISGQTAEAQEHIQKAVGHFFSLVTSHPAWDEANDENILRIPPAEDDWESKPYVTHIVPLRTRTGDEKHLQRHLMMIANINAYPISYPIVPKGQSRVRLVFHAHNSLEQVEALARAVMDWAVEMLAINSGESEAAMPAGSRIYYALEAGAQ